MSIHILHSKITGPTARELASDLQEVLADVEITCGRKKPPTDTTHMIRWGNSLKEDWDNLVPHVLNRADGIALVCQKEHTLRALRQYTVLTPDWRRDALQQNMNRPFPFAGTGATDTNTTPTWLIRERYGFGGRGILPGWRNMIIPAHFQAPFLVQYIPNSHEVRAHICRDRSLRLQVKRHAETNVFATDEPFMVRNHSNGWKLVPLSGVLAREQDLSRRRIREAAKRALRACNLDFGAVDMVRSAHDWYVLEINSAPRLEEPSRLRYIRAFALWYGSTLEECAPARVEELEATLGYQDTARATRNSWRDQLIEFGVWSSNIGGTGFETRRPRVQAQSAPPGQEDYPDGGGYTQCEACDEQVWLSECPSEDVTCPNCGDVVYYVE